MNSAQGWSGEATQTLGMAPATPGALKVRRRLCEWFPALLQSAAVMPFTNPGSSSLG